MERESDVGKETNNVEETAKREEGVQERAES